MNRQSMTINRFYHWVIAALLIAQLLSGLMLIDPRINVLALGQSRSLLLFHRSSTIAMLVFLIIMILIRPRTARNLFRTVFGADPLTDNAWKVGAGKKLVGLSSDLSNVHTRLDFGQKKFIISELLLISVLVVTGLCQWFSGGLPGFIVIWMAPIHELTFFLFAMIMAWHIYLRTIVRRPQLDED